MFNSKDAKIKLEFLKHSIKSYFPSYWLVIGVLVSSLYYFLSVWTYNVDSGLTAKVKTISSSHGYGNSSYRVSAEYAKGENKINIIVDLPSQITLQEGDEFIVNRNYRYLLPDNYTFVSKVSR